MRWLEEIRLRTQPQKEKEVIEILLEMAESVHEHKELGLASVSVYFHKAQPGGFSLILQWNTASIPMHGSDTAMLILEGIKSLGLFDHTVMVESGKTVKVNFNRREIN